MCVLCELDNIADDNSCQPYSDPLLVTLNIGLTIPHFKIDYIELVVGRHQTHHQNLTCRNLSLGIIAPNSIQVTFLRFCRNFKFDQQLRVCQVTRLIVAFANSISFWQVWFLLRVLYLFLKLTFSQKYNEEHLANLGPFVGN